jgi:methylglyoxal synthase
MMRKTIMMARRKNIALVAHDNKKEELVEWAKCHCILLAEHSLYSTRRTGQLLENRLGLKVTLLESGPLGGDQQIGSRISEGQIDFVIFFSDPLQSQAHDPDVKALLRITVVWNVPIACNQASADFIVSSPLMSTGYERQVPITQNTEHGVSCVPNRNELPRTQSKDTTSASTKWGRGRNSHDVRP